MIDPSWRIEDPDPDEGTTAGPQPGLVSLHYLRNALRRRWRLWGSLAFVGMLLGAASSVLMPAPSSGTVTLLLAHDVATNADSAMATDVTIAQSRIVSARTLARLGLQMEPEDFQPSVMLDPVTSNVLVISVTAPDDTAAVTRARTFSQEFLRYRNAQVQSQSTSLINTYRQQVTSLRGQVKALTEQYQALSKSAADQSQAADLLTQRSQLKSEISSSQQSIQETSLQSGSIIAASHVLDPPRAVPHSTKRRVVLATGSGLVGGMGLGIGLVLFTALTSQKLRRREEVALALGVPVRLSVGSLRRRRWLPRIRRGSSDARDLQVLVHGLDSVITPRRGRPRKGKPAQVALATTDNVEAAARVVETLGEQLALRGLAVFLVDLSESGQLAGAARGHDTDEPSVAETPPAVASFPKAELERQLATLPQLAVLEKLTRQRKEAERLARVARTVVDDLARAQDQADADVERVKARSRSDQKRIDGGQIATPKERKGVQDELSSLEQLVSELEDAELEVMEQLEAATLELDALTAQIAALDDQIKAATATRDKAARKIKRQLAAEAGDPAHPLEQGDSAEGPPAAPVVFRPEGVPSLARGPLGVTASVTGDLPENDLRRPAWNTANVILTLAEVDPAIGVDHLKSWADQVVLLVTAGRSSAERLTTTSELMREAGLDLLFAMMVGADRTDESLGLPDPSETDRPSTRGTA